MTWAMPGCHPQTAFHGSAIHRFALPLGSVSWLVQIEAMTKRTVIRDIPDALATIPLMLGFQPADSVVMVAYRDDKSSFIARADLLPTASQQQTLAEYLIAAAINNGRTAVVLVYYTADAELAEQHASKCAEVIAAEGLKLTTAIRVHDGHFFATQVSDPQLAQQEPGGLPFDNASHPATLEAHFDGHVVRESRADLAQSLKEYDQADARKIKLELRSRRRSQPLTEASRYADARWLQHRLRSFAEDRRPLDVRDCAKVLDLITDIELRDIAWMAMKERSMVWMDFWLQMTRRSSQLRANDRKSAVALLAFASWHAGDGAMAWCAVEHCLNLDRHYSMAHLISDILMNAIPPDAWKASDDSIFEVFRNADPADPSGASAS